MIRLGVGPVWQSGLLVLCGLATYFFWPRPLRPKGSYDMQALPAVIGPDLLGIALTSFFVALPLWIGRGQGGEGLHGSVLLLWPMALASVSLLVVGLRNTCLGLEIAQDCLVLTRFSGRSEILFDEIRKTHRWRSGLPRILRALLPFLPPGPAGAILLARDSSGIELELTDGQRLKLPHDGFERGEAALLRALRKHRVGDKPRETAR